MAQVCSAVTNGVVHDEPVLQHVPQAAADEERGDFAVESAVDRVLGGLLDVRLAGKGKRTAEEAGMPDESPASKRASIIDVLLQAAALARDAVMAAELGAQTLLSKLDMPTEDSEGVHAQVMTAYTVVDTRRDWAVEAEKMLADELAAQCKAEPATRRNVDEAEEMTHNVGSMRAEVGRLELRVEELLARSRTGCELTFDESLEVEQAYDCIDGWKAAAVEEDARVAELLSAVGGKGKGRAPFAISSIVSNDECEFYGRFDLEASGSGESR